MQHWQPKNGTHDSIAVMTHTVRDNGGEQYKIMFDF